MAKQRNVSPGTLARYRVNYEYLKSIGAKVKPNFSDYTVNGLRNLVARERKQFEKIIRDRPGARELFDTRGDTVQPYAYKTANGETQERYIIVYRELPNVDIEVSYVELDSMLRYYEDFDPSRRIFANITVEALTSFDRRKFAPKFEQCGIHVYEEVHGEDEDGNSIVVKSRTRWIYGNFSAMGSGLASLQKKAEQDKNIPQEGSDWKIIHVDQCMIRLSEGRTQAV